MFYTYLWLRYDGTPYYVGKGKDNRAYISHGHGGLHKPPDKERIIVQYYISEEEAFAAEMFFVDFYGRKDLRKGTLHNRTDGGEGRVGCPQTEEAKEKVRKAVNELLSTFTREQKRERIARAQSACRKPVSVEEVVAGYISGKSTGDLAKEHSVSKDTIRKLLKAKGILLRKVQNRPGYKLTTEQKAAIAKRMRGNKNGKSNRGRVLKMYCLRGHVRNVSNVDKRSGYCKTCKLQQQRKRRRMQCPSLQQVKLGSHMRIPKNSEGLRN